MRKSKQENRDDAAKAIALTIKRLMTSMRQIMESDLEGDSMTLAQLRMLSALEEEPEISSASLARTCFVTPQSMQTLVARAEREGWIRRSPSAQNRRILTASLTPKGRRVFQRGKDLWATLSREMWSQTKLSEMEALNSVLSAAVDRLQPMVAKLHDRQNARRKSA